MMMSYAIDAKKEEKIHHHNRCPWRIPSCKYIRPVHMLLEGTIPELIVKLEPKLHQK